MPDRLILHPVTRITCGVFAALAGPAAIIMSVRVLTSGHQDVAMLALFLVLTSMALLTGYIAVNGRFPRSRLWAAVAAPTLLTFLIIPIVAGVTFIHGVIAGDVVFSLWWLVPLVFIFARMSAQGRSGGAGTPPGR